MTIWWDPDAVYARPWPGSDGKSTQYEVGGRGMAAPVTVLGEYVSWRDGKHLSIDQAEATGYCLLRAVQLARENS